LSVKEKGKINTIRLQGILGTGHRHRKFAYIVVNNKTLRMQLDTAADVITIGKKTWTRIFRPILLLYTVTCVNVSGHILHIKGFFNASLSYKDRSTKAPIIVIDRPETALISAQAIDELGLISYDTGIINNQQKVNSIVENSLQKQFTELFGESTGECTKMTVHLRLKPDAQPHVPRRPIILALEEPINNELDRLINNGILTPIDFSEWAAPLSLHVRQTEGYVFVQTTLQV